MVVSTGCVMVVLASSILAAEPPAQINAKNVTELALEDALKQLDAQNLSIVQIRNRAIESKALASQSMVSVLPYLSANGSYTRNNAEAVLALSAILTSIERGLTRGIGRPVELDRSAVPGDQIMQPLDSFNASIALRIPIFAANSYSDIGAANRIADAVSFSAKAVSLQMQKALIQAAWWLSAAEESFSASQRALVVAQEHEKSALRAVKAGTSAPLVHLQAQTEVIRRQSDLVRARSECERSRLAIGALLGKQEPIRVLLPSLSARPIPEKDELVRLAFLRRPELNAKELELDAARKQLDSAWWRLAPTISAAGAVFASSAEYLTGEHTGWKASVELNWPLYDGGLRSGKRAEAEAAVARTKAALEQEKIDVSRQVKDSAREIGVARERLALAEKQKEYAAEMAASARRSFEAGIASSLDVLDANDRLYFAEIGLGEARANVGAAIAALNQAVGGAF